MRIFSAEQQCVASVCRVTQVRLHLLVHTMMHHSFKHNAGWNVLGAFSAQEYLRTALQQMMKERNAKVCRKQIFRLAA